MKTNQSKKLENIGIFSIFLRLGRSHGRPSPFLSALALFLTIAALSPRSIRATPAQPAPRISLPATLEALPLQPLAQGELLVSARTKQSADGFPTFNALLLSGSFRGEGDPPPAQGEQVAASYRLVGLSGVQSEDSVLDLFQGYQRLTTSLSYSSGDREMSSRVVILSLENQHLILTWTATRAERQALPPLATSMLESIVLPGVPLNRTSSTDILGGSSHLTSILAAVALVAILGGVTALFKARS